MFQGCAICGLYVSSSKIELPMTAVFRLTLTWYEKRPRIEARTHAVSLRQRVVPRGMNRKDQIHM